MLPIQTRKSPARFPGRAEFVSFNFANRLICEKVSSVWVTPVFIASAFVGNRQAHASPPNAGLDVIVNSPPYGQTAPTKKPGAGFPAGHTS